MGVLSRIVQSSTAEIEAGGLRWRVRRVSSEDLAALGHAMALVMPTGDREPEDDPVRLLRRFAEGDVRAIKRAEAAVVCAAVEQVWDDEEQAWESVTLIRDGQSDAARGRVAVRDLPRGCVDDLYAGIDDFLAGHKEGRQALSTFRGGDAVDGDDRPDRDEVRPAPE